MRRGAALMALVLMLLTAGCRQSTQTADPVNGFHLPDTSRLQRYGCGRNLGSPNRRNAQTDVFRTGKFGGHERRVGR